MQEEISQKSSDAQIGYFSDSRTKKYRYSENGEMFNVLETIIGRRVLSKWFCFMGQLIK